MFNTSYTAVAKRMYGVVMGDNYNKSKKENPEMKHCPKEKDWNILNYYKKRVL